MDTEIFKKDPALMPKEEVKDSAIFNVSVRSWLAIMLTGTVCAMSVYGMTVTEPLYTMAGLALGFYFGQKTNKT